MQCVCADSGAPARVSGPARFASAAPPSGWSRYAARRLRVPGGRPRTPGRGREAPAPCPTCGADGRGGPALGRPDAGFLPHPVVLPAAVQPEAPGPWMPKWPTPPAPAATVRDRQSRRAFSSIRARTPRPGQRMASGLEVRGDWRSARRGEGRRACPLRARGRRGAARRRERRRRPTRPAAGAERGIYLAERPVLRRAGR